MQAHTPAVQVRQWLALSRWSILHFSARLLGQIFGNLYTVVPMLVGALQGGLYFVVLGGSAMVVAVVTMGAIRQRFFRYRIDETRIQLREGFLNKKQLSLDYHRIQNITVEHPFYFRPLKLVMLKVDGAGSSGEEISLVALSHEMGEALRTFILERKTRQSAFVEDGHNPATTTDLLISRSMFDLVLHGITNNRAWVIAGVAAGALGQASDDLGPALASIGIDIGTTVKNYAEGLSLMSGVLALAALLAVVFLLMAAASILGSLFTYYDYRLNTTGTGYLETRGLATRREVNMQQSRIQALAVEQNWLDALVERMHVVLEQISHTKVEQPLDSGNTRIMVPSVTFDESMNLLQNFDPSLPDVRDLDFAPISIRYWIKMSLCLLPIYAALPFVMQMAWTGLLFLALFGVHSGIGYLRYKRWGIAISGDYVVVRKGVIGIDYVVLPAFKLQRMRIHETPFTRRRKLASVSLVVASRTVRVPFIDRALARNIMNYCAHAVESSPRSWM